MNIFFNEKENRLRAGWRLLMQFILMAILAGTGAAALQMVLPGSPLLINALAQFVGIIASVWIAATYLDKRSIYDFGITLNKKWGIEFLVGSGIAAVAVLGIFFVEYAAGWITVTNYFNIQHAGSSFAGTFLISFLAMLMVGFHEELFSRGYQILNLVEGLRNTVLGMYGAVIMAVLLTSSLFGFLHFFNPNASFISTFNIILAGGVLALPYIITGRLALSVGLHFSWNFTMGGILGFPVSGQHFGVSIFKIQQNGSELWTGGAFGPEAGIAGWLGMAIMAGGTYVYLKSTEETMELTDKFKSDQKL